MATILKTKNSVTTAVSPTSLAQGELAVNITDKKLWVGNAATTPVQLLGTGADGFFSNITDAGNLTFTGTTNRIYGDFANATDASRVVVQNSTTNSNTVFSVAPNGTGNIAGFNTYGSTSVANCAVGAFYISTAGANINSYKIGTGTTLPIVFNIDSSEIARFSTAGNLGIGNNAPTAKLHVNGSIISNSYACNSATGNATITNTSAGDNRPLYIENSNAAGTPNGSLFIKNANDANNTTYSFIQAVGGSTPRFIVYGNGDVNTTGALTTKSRGITTSSVPAGSIIQVVAANYSTSVTNSSSTPVATGLSATITPQFSNSKILIIVNHTGCNVTSAATAINLELKRGSTTISNLGVVLGYPATGGVTISNSGTVYDSPATTSATTYSTTIASWQNLASVTAQWQGSTSFITLMEIAV